MDQLRFRNLLITEDATVRDCIEAIDAGAIEIALVTDERERLLGTVTDGDIRRALLRGSDLDDPVEAIVHRNPISASVGTPSEDLLEVMTQRGIEQVPLLDGERLVDV